jgi:predicted deacetylase
LVPVHVSIHDVSPAWAREVELALRAAGRVGARPALLVVPDFHGKWPLGEHPAFAARLRTLQAEGHEVYLHGFWHRTLPRWDAHDAAPGGNHVGNAAGRLRTFFRQRIVSAGEAEFAELDLAEAARRLDQGEKVLGAEGLTIDGFVAPAWSMPKGFVDLLGTRGYRFTEDHTHVYDPAAGRKRASVVLNYASRTPARLFSSVAYCRVAKHAKVAIPARVAIHPADMRFRLLRSEVDALLAWAAPDLTPRGTELLGAPESPCHEPQRATTTATGTRALR